jgi:ABC-type multidrug transport system ATPase subunit/predicted component of type VI protein secretion system
VGETQFRIVLVSGPSPGREFEIQHTPLIIGREPEAEYQIIIPSSTVSRRHARIRQERGQLLIEDLNSSNGTFLNDEPLIAPARLKDGDSIGLGRSIRLAFHALVAETEDTDQPERTEEDDLHASSLPETVIGEFPLSEAQMDAPAKLSVVVAGSDATLHSLDKELITIGRDVDNDIVIHSKIVSRHHAQLIRSGGSYELRVLPGASNPVYKGGYPVEVSQQLVHQDRLRIGGQDPGLMVTMTYLAPAQAPPEEAIEITLQDKALISIGRDPGNDVVLDVPQVSRHHAQIERIGQRHRLTDLNSSNGTFVNDLRIAEPYWLRSEDTIRIGPYRFVVGEEALAQYDDYSSLRVEARALNKWVRDDLNILQDISLLFQEREFIVVVGQSGGGKSTLVDAIAGYRPATHGQVLVNGTDVYKNFDAIRSLIGFVPQKDIIHTELTVFEALDYTARLRMPADTTTEERHARVREVLDDLDLAHRADVQISGLSGGQQKRVSIGVELLTKPGLFFLDEPTSGLDPGTETALMQLMRRLADQGRTIVLITHATKNVMLADKVLFLARGGYLTWFGPPDEALAYFDQHRSEIERRTRAMDFDQIYAILEDIHRGTPEQWAERFKNHPAYRRYILDPLEGKVQPVPIEGPVRPAASQPKDRARQQISSLRQLMILSSRNIRILLRDRFSLALMLAAAPLVGLLDVILSALLGRDPFDVTDGNMASVLITLFLLAVYGVVVGGLAQMREIVKEGEIYRRERLVNLKIVPYVLSKVWVAVLLALYQTAAYVIIHYLAFDMPGGFLDAALIYVSLALATLAGMMLGLFASAIAPNANSAPLLVILLMLPQIVLGGALVPLPEFVSAPISTRWAFQAFMGIVGAGSDVAADACWALTADERSLMTQEDKIDFGCRCLGPSALRPESCSFPGVGQFYNPAIDQLPPDEPPPPVDRPADPDIPEPPPEPEDQSDAVAVADYLNELQAYQELVDQIRADSEAEFADYEADLEVYQSQAIAYQEDLVGWQIAREAAVLPAESLINTFHRDFGWTFVDKSDPDQFWPFVTGTWIAQAVIIGILFVSILVIQKRKDSR